MGAAGGLVVWLAIVACVSAQQQQQQQQSTGAANKLLAQETIDLKSILDHQEALANECAKYKAQKERELEYLLGLNADSRNLPEPIAVKVPAVCLLFLAASLDEKLAASGIGAATGTRASPKLELVNWIFNEEELARNGSNGISKRQAPGNGDELSIENNRLLSDYFLDPRVAMAADGLAAAAAAANEVGAPAAAGNPELSKFHKDIDALMADSRFQSGIEQSKPKLATHLSPVILIPGLLGSRLQARTNKAHRVNIFCTKQSDWQDMWLSLRMFLPIAVDCWLDNVRLELDPSTGFVRQPEGVEARVADFGSVESVRHLDLNQPKLTSYYQPLIERYEQLGYTANRNLLAAPYDFRLAPQQLTGFFKDLKNLIDWAQDESPSGKPVTLVCHSMGCTHALIFLRQQSPAWRQSRIRKLIALSSPWGGTMKALKALVVGDQLELPLVSETKMRRLARTYPSIAYLMPQASVFEQQNKNQVDDLGGPILVQTPQRTYRAKDLEQLMLDLNLAKQYEWFKVTSELIKPMEPLADLNVDCIHSLNIPTPETLIFRNQSDFPDGDYELVRGDGDGTVNLQSLEVCELWARKLPERVKQTIIVNTNHLGVIGHKVTLTHITDDVLMN